MLTTLTTSSTSFSYCCYANPFSGDIVDIRPLGKKYIVKKQS